jgi:hypothetical protein
LPRFWPIRLNFLTKRKVAFSEFILALVQVKGDDIVADSRGVAERSGVTTIRSSGSSSRYRQMWRHLQNPYFTRTRTKTPAIAIRIFYHITAIGLHSLVGRMKGAVPAAWSTSTTSPPRACRCWWDGCGRSSQPWVWWAFRPTLPFLPILKRCPGDTLCRASPLKCAPQAHYETVEVEIVNHMQLKWGGARGAELESGWRRI